VGAATSDSDPIHNRPPVAQTFQVDSTGGVFTAVVNHFKSKSCGDATGADLDQGDGQGCYNARQIAQAEALLDFIDTLTAGEADDDVLVIGDLNSYGEEDPIQVLEEGELVVQLDIHLEGEPYSFIFDGMSGYLDHALASSSMSGQVNDATEWHINADEPSVSTTTSSSSRRIYTRRRRIVLPTTTRW